jgi:uncharacterized protein YutE (UPF0331/DUF86 family)
MPFDDVMINKIQSIQRCIFRAKEEYQIAGKAFQEDFSRQDAAILNVTRACEQTIDLANYLIKKHKYGVPTSSRESFEILARYNIISIPLSQQLQKMVGFRNIAIHEYQKLNPQIIISIIEHGLEDLFAFTVEIIKDKNL